MTDNNKQQYVLIAHIAGETVYWVTEFKATKKGSEDMAYEMVFSDGVNEQNFTDDLDMLEYIEFILKNADIETLIMPVYPENLRP